MGDHAPRDMSEWMSSVERRLRGATQAAASIPRSYSEKLQGDIAADKVRHPTAPVEITYQTAIYTADGLAREYARLMVDFPDVTKATDGTDIPIMQYELWGRDDTANFLDATTDSAPGLAAPGLTMPSLASTPAMKAAANPAAPFKRLAVSAESSLRVDRLAPGTIWTFKVRAIGVYTTAPGDFSPEFQTQLDKDTTPPPQPTAPNLTVKGGAIVVRWDGQSVTGAMPGDLDYVVVAAGDASSPVTQVDTFPAGGGLMVLTDSPYYAPQFVRFQAVDLSGNRSPWSEQSTAYTVPLVDADIILSAIDAAKTLLTNVGAESLKDGAVLASKLADNAVTLAKLDSTTQAAVQAGLDALAQADVTGRTLASVQASVNGKTSITNSTSAAGPSVGGAVTGDRWQQWDTLAAGGKLVASWRWNGLAWVQELIDPTYLPQVDIGAGTFGSLTGSRLTVDSVALNKLTVSDLATFAPSYRESPTDWTLDGGMAAVADAAVATYDGYRFRSTATTGAAPAQRAMGPQLAVQPGEELYGEAMVYRTGPTTNKMYPRFYFFDAAHTYLASGGTELDGTAQKTNEPNGTKLAIKATVPAGAMYANFMLTINNATGDDLAFYNARSYRRNRGELLVDGSITATQVNAASVAAAVGQFVQIDVSQLNASAAAIGSATIDKLWTSVVNSRKITTDMLVVNGQNIMPDPYFLDATQNAARTGSSGGPWTLSADDQSTAQTIKNSTHDAAGVYRSLNLHDAGSRIPVIAGSKYTFQVDYRLRGNAVAGKTSQMRFAVYHDSPTGAYIRYVGVGSYSNIVGTGPTWNTYTSPEYLIPDDVGFIRVQVQFNNAGWDGEFEVKNPLVRAMADAALVVSGGIVTRHLTVTDDMVVALLSVHKIKAVDIDANNIVADSATIGTLRGGILIADAVTTSALKADAITSKHTITGATFQTTTSANRGIKLTSTGLQLFDNTGIKTVDLNATTGYATITGRLRTAADGSPGAVLIPPVESDDGKTMALWFTPDVAQLPGGVTAGIWMSNPATNATAGQVHVRGQQYGGVRLWDAVQFDTNTGSLPQFFSNHPAGLQMTSYGGQLYINAAANQLQLRSMFNTVINVGVAGGGGKYLNLQQNSAAYSSSISNAANMFLQTDGNVFKSTSALKFKILPEVMALDDRLLDEVHVKDWIDKGSAERYAATFDQPQPWTEQQTREFEALSLQRVPGAIAEDVAAAGGEAFVGRDLNGELESLMYERLALARTEILKHRVAAQAAEIAELRQLITDLAARIPA